MRPCGSGAATGPTVPAEAGGLLEARYQQPFEDFRISQEHLADHLTVGIAGEGGGKVAWRRGPERLRSGWLPSVPSPIPLGLNLLPVRMLFLLPSGPRPGLGSSGDSRL